MLAKSDLIVAGAEPEMLGEASGRHLGEPREQRPVRWFEPAWKAMLSPKAVLPVLWERNPDHPLLLQAFTWQTQDRAPEFPRMRQFLDHWRREIEAVIHSVRVTVAGGVDAAHFREVQDLGLLH